MGHSRYTSHLSSWDHTGTIQLLWPKPGNIFVNSVFILNDLSNLVVLCSLWDSKLAYCNRDWKTSMFPLHDSFITFITVLYKLFPIVICLNHFLLYFIIFSSSICSIVTEPRNYILFLLLFAICRKSIPLPCGWAEEWQCDCLWYWSHPRNQQRALPLHHQHQRCWCW